MNKFFKRHLFWKFFFSYFTLVLLSLLVLGVVIRILLPGIFNSHLVRMAALFGEYGFDDSQHMMGRRGQMMMGESVLFTNLFIIFNQIIFESILYALIPSLLVALAMSTFMSRQFVSPLQQLAASADRIAEGDYRARLPMGDTPAESRNELQRLAERFNYMTARLERVEDLRLKLIGDVAHELRTPLTVIKGSMEGLMDGVLAADETTFEMIYRQADRLDRLVNDLQELNLIELEILDMDIQSVKLNRFLAHVIQIMALSYANKGVNLRLQVTDTSLSVMADEDRLEQIMINLLSNALRYTPEGGNVWVEVEEVLGKVQISVRDTGIGIPADHLPNIFSRFYRVDDSRARQNGGSGIGLTIVKKLVEAQGGKIWVESSGPGEGALFTFLLPRA